MNELLASWLMGLFALIGLLVGVAAGLFVAAWCVRFAWLALRRERGEWMARSDLAQAIGEWKQRHPDWEARYERLRSDHYID